jgi:hypothetical protein
MSALFSRAKMRCDEEKKRTKTNEEWQRDM